MFDITTKTIFHGGVIFNNQNVDEFVFLDDVKHVKENEKQK